MRDEINLSFQNVNGYTVALYNWCNFSYMLRLKLKWSTRNIPDFKISFSPPHVCTTQISVFLVVFGQLIILSDRELHLMTSNPEYIPIGIQDHFHKSFELLIKIGLWLVVNSECCLRSTPLDEGFHAVLMSAVSGCKLAKLGWKNIEHQSSSFQYFFHFYPISDIH